MSQERPSLSYRDAGVDIDAADATVRAVKEMVQKTFDDNVLCDIGTFGAMYQLDLANMEQPVLVSSVDGVGTKLKLAFMTGKHDTVGIDLVSHCVNDILVQGARPLFFLDYLACGKMDPSVSTSVIQGVANGCRYAGCALIGGETAEMPGMYDVNEYDLAGTIVGIVDRGKIIEGSTINPGDAVIGLGSSGLHTNGYSLARKIVFEVAGLSCDDELPGTGQTVGEAMLEPHRSYSKIIQLLMKIVKVKGMAHITGGGITDNLPRALPKKLGVQIDLGAWKVPSIFTFLRETGNVTDKEMLRTFNLGMGFLVIVGKDEVEEAVAALTQACEKPKVIGEVVPGENTVQYVGNLRYA